jgi:hypothetical protein
MDGTESRRDEEAGDRRESVDGQGEERLGHGALAADADPTSPFFFRHDKTMTFAAQENVASLVSRLRASVPRRTTRARRLAAAENGFLERVVVCGSRVVRDGMDLTIAQESVESEYQKTYGMITPVGMIIIRIVVEIILYWFKTGNEEARELIRMASTYREVQ